MQNFDFYDKNTSRNIPPHYDTQDAEYFSRLSSKHIKDQEKTRKRASRMIFLIAALCIISFTGGLILGIKFASGSEKEILDKNTVNAMKGLKNKVSNLISPSEKKNIKVKNAFPKDNYPFVVKLDGVFDQNSIKTVSYYLIKKGHTVIQSKQNIYIGPFSTVDRAKTERDKIISYNHRFLKKTPVIIKR